MNLAQHEGRLLVDHSDIVRNAVRYVKTRRPFHIDAFVVYWATSTRYGRCRRATTTTPRGGCLNIKTNFSRRMVRGERVRRSRMGKGERGIWQRRYWEHLIRDDTAFTRHVDYIHYNPVKHGYADAAAHWPYSSIHRYIARGIIPVEWGWNIRRSG